MTVQDIIDDCRPLLGDSVFPYQFLAEHYYLSIDRSVRRLAQERPASLYVSTVTTDLPADVTAVGDTVGVHDNYRDMLVGLVVADLQQQDKTIQTAPPPAGEESP